MMKWEIGRSFSNLFCFPTCYVKMKKPLIGRAESAVSNEIPSEKSFKVSIINLFGRWNKLCMWNELKLWTGLCWVCGLRLQSLMQGPHTVAPSPLKSYSLSLLLITPWVGAAVSQLWRLSAAGLSQSRGFEERGWGHLKSHWESPSHSLTMPLWVRLVRTPVITGHLASRKPLLKDRATWFRNDALNSRRGKTNLCW